MKVLKAKKQGKVDLQPGGGKQAPSSIGDPQKDDLLMALGNRSKGGSGKTSAKARKNPPRAKLSPKANKGPRSKKVGY